jgi:hypothetical protein
MKSSFILVFLFLSVRFLYGQEVTPQNPQKVAPTDTIVRSKGNDNKQLEQIKEVKIKNLSDSTNNEPVKSALVDTTKQNKYGDLLEDDPLYNRKYHLWIPAVEVFGINTSLNLIDRYVFKLDFANVDLTTWKRTVSAGWPWGPGWMWDQDRFANNFISHPYTGSLYYNAARANGYKFILSATFAMGGSYMWKIFGEKGTPEREDPINTTSTGIFLGEILYLMTAPWEAIGFFGK